LLSQHYDVTSV